jgi:hypothetical protein
MGFDFEYIKRKMPASLALSDADFERKVKTDKAQEEARIYASEALLMLVGLMRSSKDEKIKVKCAITIIDRAYGSPKQVVENTGGGDSIVEVLARISSNSEQPQLTTVNPVIDVLSTNDGQ